MTQATLFKPNVNFEVKNHVVDIAEDAERQRALEGLPHYWKINWGYFDTVFEACGFSRWVPVSQLEDPKFKLKPQCPWNPTKHRHTARDEELNPL